MTTSRARRTGRKCAPPSHTARALIPGPYRTRPDGTPSDAPTGDAPTGGVVPRAGWSRRVWSRSPRKSWKVLAATRCSVTWGRGDPGETSKTCRRDTTKTSAPSRASPQPRHAADSPTTVTSGSSTNSSVEPGAPCCLPQSFPDHPREERLSADRFTNGESNDSGHPLVDESHPSRARNTASRPSQLDDPGR
ncbi:MAG: hypothetical protein ACRDRH_27345 [Pseudonocardia sp.]